MNTTTQLKHCREHPKYLYLDYIKKCKRKMCALSRTISLCQCVPLNTPHSGGIVPFLSYWVIENN